MDANKDVNVRAVVERCLEQAQGDAVKACALLESEIVKDFTLYRSVMSKYESDACWKLIGKEKRSRREPVYLPPNYDPTGKSERVLVFAKANQQMSTEKQRKEQQQTKKK